MNKLRLFNCALIGFVSGTFFAMFDEAPLYVQFAVIFVTMGLTMLNCMPFAPAHLDPTIDHKGRLG